MSDRAKARVRSFADMKPGGPPRVLREPTIEERAEAVRATLFREILDKKYETKRFHRLWTSNEGDDGKQSEDDFELFKLLALGTRDAALIEYMADQSPRQRPKWETKRGAATWLGFSIQNAIAETESEYDKRRGGDGDSDEPAQSAVKLTLAEYLKDPDALKPPEPVIPRLAWPGHITLLASPEGWGKSTHTRAGCAAVTTGQRFLDANPVPPGDVLWALLEEPVATCMISAHRFGMDPARFTTWRKPGADPVAELVAAIQEMRPAVTVVDSIQELGILAGVENLDDAVQVGRALMPLVDVCRDTGTAMVWLAQANKATGKYRNSSWFGHQADVSLDIAEPEEGSGVRKITARKTRIEGVRTYRVELVGNLYQLASGDTEGLDGTRLTVRDALPKDGGLSDTAWERASLKAGVSETTYKRHKRWLEKEGYVMKHEGLWQRHLE